MGLMVDILKRRGLQGTILTGVLLISAGICLSCARSPGEAVMPDRSESERRSAVEGKVVCIDPGHGGTAETDQYRVGPSGEREEWVNLRVAQALRHLLEDRGATVVMTRTQDAAVELKERADMAVAAGADVFLSIHHNATADRSVNFPIIYFHANASENEASVRLAKLLGQEIRAAMFDAGAPLSVVSDHTIFPGAGAAVLRQSYGIPGVIGEASFFSNAEEEARLKDGAYNEREAAAYLAALEKFFSEAERPILDKYSTGRIDQFAVAQEADRMKPEALEWRADYEKAAGLMKLGDEHSTRVAYDLFSRSARNFPDSPVARDCHLGRAEALRRLGREAEAGAEDRRVKEFYPE